MWVAMCMACLSCVTNARLNMCKRLNLMKQSKMDREMNYDTPG